MKPTRPTVASFKGLNNTTDPLALDLSWQVRCDNAVITQAGKIQRARGYTKRVTGSAITGGYATEDMSRLYIVDSGTLYQVNADYSKVALKTGLSSVAMRFAEVNGVVYYANGTDYGTIEPDGARPWGVPVPNPVTALTTGTGMLKGGTYQVCCTLVDDRGMESGNSDIAMITVDDDAQIAITGIPQVAGYSTNVYVTAQNGDVFKLLRAEAGAEATYNCALEDLGPELPFLFCSPPHGTLPAYFAGRMYLAEAYPQDDVSVVWRSHPLHYHLFDDGNEGITVPGSVRMLAACQEALIIGTDREIYALDAGAQLQKLAPYGVVPGDHAAKLDGQVFFWSLRGLVQALPFRNLTQATVSVAPGVSACGKVIEQDGWRRYQAALHKGGTAYNAR